jgi:hypothetical protein
VAVGAYLDASGSEEALIDTLTGGVWTPVAAPLPTNAAAEPSAELTSVTCVAAGSCVAVGGYSAKKSEGSGLAETLSGGVWTPRQVSSATLSNFLFTAVTCPAAGSCVAVGEGSSGIGGLSGVIGTLSGGTWTVTEVSLPPSAPAGALELLNAVTCPAVGSCVAVGGYAVLGAKSIVEEGLIDTLAAGQWTVTTAPLGSKKSAHDLGFLGSVACSAVGSCVAGGSIANKSGKKSSGLLEGLSNGTWAPVAVPLPADALPGQFSNFNAVTCPAAGTCVAVSSYTDASGNQQGLIETMTGGTWTATEAPVPANAAADPLAGLDGISCPSAGACVAVGGYFDSSVAQQGLVDTLSGGTWTASEAPLPAGAGGPIPPDAAPFQKSTFRMSRLLTPLVSGSATERRLFNLARPFAGLGSFTAASHGSKSTSVAVSVEFGLQSVSCATTESCAALGNVESATSGEGLIDTLSDGTWTTSEAVPADAGLNIYAQLDGVACGAPASCLAVGSYDDTSGEGEGFVETISGTTSAPLELPVPADAAADPQVNLVGATCPAAGSCVAVGNYADATGDVEGLVETLAHGAWTPTDVPLPSGTTNPNANLASVACPEVGTCVAVGETLDLTGRVEQALVETLSSGTWTASVASLPGKTNKRPESELSGVTCPAVGSCQAVGAYEDGKLAQGMLETFANGIWTPTSVPAPGATGSSFSDLGGVSCAGVTTCVAVGTYSDIGGVNGFVDTLKDGTWTQTEVSGPSKSGESNLITVSCPSSAACVAVGSAEGESDGELTIEPYFDSLQGKKWTSTVSPTPSDVSIASFGSVSCAAVGSCVSVGFDGTLSGSLGGFIDTLSAG